MIALMDCNNFFVSCELTLKPELRGRPVVVCGPNGGCAVAMSNEAKAVGITRGVPMFKVKPLVERYGIVMLPATHGLYSEISSRIMHIVGSIVDDIEVYSIDEAFLHIPFKGEDAVDFCKYLRQELLDRTGIPVSIGLSTTKTLAKIAARFAKRHKGYGGVCLMNTQEKIRRALELTDAKDVWGLGRRLNRQMRASGIMTAANFADMPEDYVARAFSVNVVRTHRELHGVECFDRLSHKSVHHTVSHTRTFARDLYDFGDVGARVAEYAASVASHLRRYNRLAASIEVFITTNPYHEQQPQYTGTHMITLYEPTNDTMEIAKAASIALSKAWKPGYGYKRAGVTAMKTESCSERQLSLFADREKEERRSRLMRTIDRINKDGAKVRLASMQRRPETDEQKRSSNTEWQ